MKKRREEAAEEQRLEDLNYTELRPIQRGAVHRKGTKIFKDKISGLLVYEDQRKKITVVEKDEDADDITAAFSYLFREYNLVFHHINYGTVHEKADDNNQDLKEEEEKIPEKDLATRLAEADKLAAGKPKRKKGKKKVKSKEGKSKDSDGKTSSKTKTKSSSSKSKSTTSKEKLKK